MKNNSFIKLEGIKFKKELNTLIRKIKSYDHIAIFRHIMPDFDALGSQLGLATWIKDNFPNKDVKVLGDNHVTFTPRGLFPPMDKVDDIWFRQKFLSIIVDVGGEKRIADPRFKKGDYLIKIDHHPKTDDIFDLDILDTEKAAASELIVALLLNKKEYVLSPLASKYFYIALVGDSGRFQFSSTTPLTFEIACELIQRDLNITKIYETMYQKNIKDLEILKFILSTYKVSKKGVAYYVFNQEDLDRFNLVCEQGKENVNFFSNYEGINIWCSITYDKTEPCYRISIRSRNYVINGVATEFGGGGHAQASGARIDDLSQLPKFIEALDSLIK